LAVLEDLSDLLCYLQMNLKILLRFLLLLLFQNINFGFAFKESTLAAIRMKEELESKSKINVLEQQ
jgi:hypothetical protein